MMKGGAKCVINRERDHSVTQLKEILTRATTRMSHDDTMPSKAGQT